MRRRPTPTWSTSQAVILTLQREADFVGRFFHLLQLDWRLRFCEGKALPVMSQRLAEWGGGRLRHRMDVAANEKDALKGFVYNLRSMKL